jgi:hypothetical protein
LNQLLFLHNSIQLTKEKTLKDENNLNIVAILCQIWNKMLGTNHEFIQENDNFIKSGGNSLKAIMFIDELKNLIALKDQVNDKILDQLLNHSFKSLIDSLTVEKNEKKSIKLLKSENSQNYYQFNEPKQSVNWISKCNRNLFIKNETTVNFPIQINLEWKFNTTKCVDSTCLIVSQGNNDASVFIGSHSKIFYCIDANSGQMKWDFKTNDRIESSATLSKCNNFILVTSYDGYFYTIDRYNGDLKWKFKTGDIIKSSPCTDLMSGLVYVGSYDKHLYCFDIYVNLLYFIQIITD